MVSRRGITSAGTSSGVSARRSAGCPRPPVLRSGSEAFLPTLGASPELVAAMTEGQDVASKGMGARRAIVEARRDEINELVRRHHGRSVSLFGSVARGDDHADSDLDFLVEFDTGSSLFDLMDLQEALESLLGTRVDVVSVGGLKDRDDHIRREAVPI